jgi:hypothetical protein
MRESSPRGDNKKSFSNVSIGNPLLWHKRIDPPVKPGDDSNVVIPDLIGNPESFEGPKEEWIPFFKGMTPHFVIPECIYRESTAFTKEWIPVYTGMTKRARE